MGKEANIPEARPSGPRDRTLDPSASLEFRQALLALRVGRIQEAADGFRELVEHGSLDPLHISYHGLMLAVHGQRRREGLEACERALVLSPDEPRILANLARVHKACGRAEKAAALLRASVRKHPHDRALLLAIDRLLPRRRPALRSLDRDHLLNKYIGKLRARWFR